jgi:SAM-dependent methyltransferase
LLFSPPQNLRFWAKTGLQYFAPRLFAASPLVEQPRDENYDVHRDRHPVREKHNGQGGWQATPDADGILRRDYANYDEYVLHQQQKLDEMLKVKGGFSRQTILEYRLTFYARFRHLKGLLPPDATMLCLGARQGTEVEVLRDLGFHRAIGLDLNPGPGNPFVIPGDFMKLEHPDESVDFIYTNCLDHAFDLDTFFAGNRRVLKPNGYALYDFSISEAQGTGVFEAVSWRRAEEMIPKLLGYFQEIVAIEREPQWLWVLVRGKRA